MNWLNYHHLIYFREIAKHGSLVKASKYLKVGQPSLSAQLKTFEEYLGIQLFERKKQRLVLNEAGKIALEYADRISELGQEFLKVMSDQSYTARGKFSVGSTDAVPKHVVSYILDFAHKSTGCFLTILEAEPSELLRSLVAHRIDVILSDQNLQGSSSDSSLLSTRMFHRPIHAYGTSDFQSVAEDFPRSLNGAPCILPTYHSKLRSDLEHYFNSHNLIVDRIAETQDSMLQKILASKSDGIVFLPEVALKKISFERPLIKLGSLDNVFAEYFLTYRKRVFGNAALETLLKQDFSDSVFLFNE